MFHFTRIRRKQNSLGFYLKHSSKRGVSFIYFSCRIYEFLAKHDTCVFIAIVLVGLSGGRFSDQKSCCLSSKTREKRTFVGAEWLNLVPRWLEWRRLTVEILWDEEGEWPEVRKSRACSRECPVVWPLWKETQILLPLTRNDVCHKPWLISYLDLTLTLKTAWKCETGWGLCRGIVGNMLW